MEAKEPLRFEERFLAGLGDWFGRVQNSVYRIPVGLLLLLFVINTGNGYATWASGNLDFPDPDAFLPIDFGTTLLLIVFPPYPFFIGWVVFNLFFGDRSWLNLMAAVLLVQTICAHVCLGNDIAPWMNPGFYVVYLFLLIPAAWLFLQIRTHRRNSRYRPEDYGILIIDKEPAANLTPAEPAESAAGQSPP